MPRQSSQRSRKPPPGPSNSMEVDSGSDSEENETVLQVSKNLKKINVSRDGRRGRTNDRHVDSDSDKEPQTSKNMQRMNGSQKRQRSQKNASQVVSDRDEETLTSQASQKKRPNNTFQSQRAHQTLSQASTSRAGETLIDEEIPASQISPNSSLTEQEHDHHVANVVKYILAADNHRKVPIEKSKISKDINCHNKTFRDIFKSAQQVLKEVFGYVMIDMEDDNKSQGKQTKLQKFILVNTVNCEDLSHDIDEDTNTRYVLLFLTLSHIFMSGEKCTEDSLKNFLKKLEIVTDQHTRHYQFRDAMETIMNDFVKEKYINVEGSDKVLTWGVRAIKELKPRTVMEFLSEIYDGRDINTWPQEYNLLLRREEEMNQRQNGQVNGKHD